MESLVAARSPKKRVSHNLSTVDFLFGEKKKEKLRLNLWDF